MNLKQANNLVNIVNNLLFNEQKFSLNFSSMYEAKTTAKLTLKSFTNWSNNLHDELIDSISIRDNMLKITCFYDDAEENSCETVYTINFDKVYANLTTNQQFGSFTSNCEDEDKADFNKFVKDHKVYEK